VNRTVGAATLGDEPGNPSSAPATCNLQLATENWQTATCNVPRATWSPIRAA